MSKKRTSEIKERHIKICLERDVESSIKTGFERYYLINHSLPEMRLEDVDTSTLFLGKKISAPFIISPMTGGARISKRINRNLALAAQKLRVIMAVGSQRLALDDSSLIDTYRVRDIAPDIPILANLGAIYLNYGYGVEACKRVVEMIEADGLVLYLNPLQKIFQGDIDPNFKGVLMNISNVCRVLDIPVIVKEVGFGISSTVAARLRDAGVWAIDVAGAGGTCWVKIEKYILGKKNPYYRTLETFENWGIPTAESLVSVCRVIRDIPIIASGGIRTGLDMAKAIALGASYCGMALPLLGPAMESPDAIERKIRSLIDELKISMFCCGKRTIEELKKGDCIKKLDIM